MYRGAVGHAEFHLRAPMGARAMTAPRIKVALWLRVSTGEQHAENQLPELQAWANRRGWEVTKVYQVQESAWRGGHQKALAQVVEDAKLVSRQAFSFQY